MSGDFFAVDKFPYRRVLQDFMKVRVEASGFAVAGLNFDSFGEAFGGTAVVALEAASERERVVYVVGPRG